MWATLMTCSSLRGCSSTFNIKIGINGISEMNQGFINLSDYHLCGEEEGCGCDGVSVEAVEGVEHVEPLHVHDRRVDAQLGPAIEGKGSHVNGIMISLLECTLQGGPSALGKKYVDIKC